MTEYLTLSNNYGSVGMIAHSHIRDDQAYLFRHGDYFERRGDSDNRFYTRAMDEKNNAHLITALSELPDEYIWDVVDDNYMVDVHAKMGIDRQLFTSLELVNSGLTIQEIDKVRCSVPSGSDWTSVPQPWQHRDAYLIGDGERFSVTLANKGQTNNKIDGAAFIYPLTKDGEWTNISNITIRSYANIQDTPTFNIDKRQAHLFLQNKDVDVNWNRGMDVYAVDSDTKFRVYQVPHSADSRHIVDDMAQKNGMLVNPMVLKIVDNGQPLAGPFNETISDMFKAKHKQTIIKPTSEEISHLYEYGCQVRNTQEDTEIASAISEIQLGEAIEISKL